MVSAIELAFNSGHGRVLQPTWLGRLPYGFLLSLTPSALLNLSAVAGLEMSICSGQ